jgi:hypothetical protein
MAASFVPGAHCDRPSGEGVSKRFESLTKRPFNHPVLQAGAGSEAGLS